VGTSLFAEWKRPILRRDPDTSAKYWPPVSRIDNVATAIWSASNYFEAQ
jgi:hypothetical protein